MRLKNFYIKRDECLYQRSKNIQESLLLRIGIIEPYIIVSYKDKSMKKLSKNLKPRNKRRKKRFCYTKDQIWEYGSRCGEKMKLSQNLWYFGVEVVTS